MNTLTVEDESVAASGSQPSHGGARSARRIGCGGRTLGGFHQRIGFRIGFFSAAKIAVRHPGTSGAERQQQRRFRRPFSVSRSEQSRLQSRHDRRRTSPPPTPSSAPFNVRSLDPSASASAAPQSGQQRIRLGQQQFGAVGVGFERRTQQFAGPSGLIRTIRRCRRQLCIRHSRSRRSRRKPM